MQGQTVYIDLTLITNLGADFLLLYFTVILSGMQIRWWRLLVAAGVGAVFALFFVLYPDSLWASPWPRLLFALLMVYIALAPLSFPAYCRAAGFFYLLAFLAGGAAYALANLGFATASVKALPGALAVACLLTVVAHRWLSQKTLATRQYCQLEIRQGEQNLFGTGFIDTGNALTDPLSGRPVIIANYHWLLPILPATLGELMADDGHWNSEAAAHLLAASEFATRCRLLPYHSIGQSGGLLLTLVFDQVKVVHQKETRLHNQVQIALVQEGLSREHDFQALVPSALI